MQCTNNQKQVVLAMHNYHDVQQSFPWGARANVFGTWAVQLFPFIEKSTNFAGYDFNASYASSSSLRDLVISVYTCPSDGNQNKLSLPSVVPPLRSHNYVVCMGREGCIDFVYKRDPSSGDPRNCLIDGEVFGRVSQYRAMFTGSCYPNITGASAAYPLTTAMENIIDGTSNTVALSETVQGLSPDGSPNDWRGLIWCGVLCFFNTNQGPNTMVADITTGVALTGHVLHPLSLMNTSTTDGDGKYIRYAARSWHTGGVNTGLADGSIRFVTNQVNLDIWRAAGSTNGGEVGSLH
jgi:hypothetical protein